MQDAKDNVLFDEAVAYCADKGEGWGLTPFSLRAAIALLSKKNSAHSRTATITTEKITSEMKKQEYPRKMEKS